MTRPLWGVTYETVTEESSREGDCAESGWIGQGLPFREALDLFNSERDCTIIEADSWPLSLDCPPRWFTDSGEVQFASGDQRAISLHIPRHVTAASAMRLARLLMGASLRGY